MTKVMESGGRFRCHSCAAIGCVETLGDEDLCAGCLKARAEKAERERDALRSIIESCCEAVWEGCDIDGGTFQDWLTEAGLLVEVPSDEWFRETWGDDAKTMFSLVWSEYVTTMRARAGGSE